VPSLSDLEPQRSVRGYVAGRIRHLKKGPAPHLENVEEVRNADGLRCPRIFLRRKHTTLDCIEVTAHPV